MSAQCGHEGIAIWLLVLGFTGQAVFGTRFLVQWLYSEIKGESHIPLAFWYISLGGASLMLAYAILRKDPVIILGQCGGLVVYSRNLYLIHRRSKEKPHIVSG